MPAEDAGLPTIDGGTMPNDANDGGARTDAAAEVSANSCPSITTILINGRPGPGFARIRHPAVVSVTAVDPDGDPLTVTWLPGATQVVVNPTAATTTVTCETLAVDGLPLAVAVSDGRCSTTVTTSLSCTPVCGDGVVDPGEECELPPQLCSFCANTCGNGRIDPGEECDFQGPGCTGCRDTQAQICRMCLGVQCPGTTAFCNARPAEDRAACFQLMSCLGRDLTACAFQFGLGPVQNCYCGAGQDCSTGPRGACRAEFEALTHTTVPAEVLASPVSLGAINAARCFGERCTNSCLGVPRPI